MQHNYFHHVAYLSSRNIVSEGAATATTCGSFPVSCDLWIKTLSFRMF